MARHYSTGPPLTPKVFPEPQNILAFCMYTWAYCPVKANCCLSSSFLSTQPPPGQLQEKKILPPSASPFVVMWAQQMASNISLDDYN